MHVHGQVAFSRHEPCPSCGSSDNLARYSDGHGYCFGCKHYEPSPSDGAGAFSRKERSVLDLITHGDYRDLPTRALTEDTLRKFGYRIAENGVGEVVHVAPYRDRDGEIVAQKVRAKNKRFSWTGEAKRVHQLFGQHLWGAGGRRVIVTEGEIDCLTVSQVQDHKWPVVSVANGAGDTQTVLRALQWLESYDEVIFMFDADDPGRDGARACAALLSPGKAKIAALPEGEDPNSLLVAGNRQAIITAIFEAHPYRPDSLRPLSDLIAAAARKPEWGFSLPFAPLHQWSYGPRPGQVWVGGAGVGIGKTDVFLEMLTEDLRAGRTSVAILLEQQPAETAQRIAAKLAGKPYFKPDCDYTEDELRQVLAPYENQLIIYDHKGSTEWEEIARMVRWSVRASGVQQVYIDNLTVLTADAADERRYLDGLMKDIKTLATELGVAVHVLSHLSTPDGTPHEEGGRVEAKQFTGSRAVMRYADYMWGLERDTQHEDAAVRATSTFRVLKDRISGQSNGRTFHLLYDHVTTRLNVCPSPTAAPLEGEATYSF